ncbi:MAG: segregation/condensation protein A [Gammaproteobacteria bacterium]|nr:segregation/condensation protein A [Gammaproteobacteria bacterium]
MSDVVVTLGEEEGALQDEDTALAEIANADAAVVVPITIAKVDGAAVTELPKDLYIPPEALEVFLEAFEGPLDLLLYLIKRQNIDILNIPIAEITRQYMEYVEMMKEIHFELAADYLVMAAMLAEIKSRLLLPRPVSEEAEEEDPRAELIRRLQEYERFKKAAEDINEMPRMERDTYQATVMIPELNIQKPYPDIKIKDLMLAFKDVLARSDMYSHHHIQLEPLSVRERMSIVLSRVEPGKFTAFGQLFDRTEGRLGVVVTFLAILELVKESLIELVQTNPYEPIHVTVTEACQTQSNN